MAKMRERIKVIPEQSNQEEDKDLEVEGPDSIRRNSGFAGIEKGFEKADESNQK